MTGFGEQLSWLGGTPCNALADVECPTQPGSRCVCILALDHAAPLHRCRRCELKFAPAPPTGPAVVPPSREANSYSAYREWRETEDGALAWRHLVDGARQQAADLVSRISVYGLSEEARHILKIEINNTFRPWIADDLVEQYPELLPLIERRKRKKEKV